MTDVFCDYCRSADCKVCKSKAWNDMMVRINQLEKELLRCLNKRERCGRVIPDELYAVWDFRDSVNEYFNP